MKKLLITGASGYLGSRVCSAAKKKKFHVKALVRSEKSAEKMSVLPDEICIGQATNPDDIQGICLDVDCVISCLGITRQKDGLTYQDVDYQANMNILHEAIAANVPQFAYVSVFNGPKIRSSKLVDAKEQFVDELIKAPIAETIIRPTGFFSDMGDFMDMAAKGDIYLFGDGNLKLNPIDGDDLAEAILQAVTAHEKELNIGGPRTYTFNEIAELALDASSSKGKIRHIPDVFRKIFLRALPLLTPQKVYGPVQFFLTAMGLDANAQEYGHKDLEEFFRGMAALKKTETGK